MTISNNNCIEKSTTFKTIFLSSGLWFFAGFDLMMLSVFSTQIGKLYFPSDDPQLSILAVYGTFSISLLSRVFGGVFFGRLGDKLGRKPIVRVCLLFLILLMITSAFLPSDYSHTGDAFSVIYPTILFVITRALVGFFVGGLWPTAAVLAMENLYSIKYSRTEEGEHNNGDFKQKTKRMTWQSSLLQVGFFVGYFISEIIIIYGLQGKEFVLFTFFSQYDSGGWRSMSLFAGFFGIVWFVLLKYLPESIEWKKWNRTRHKHEIPSLTALLFSKRNTKNREILFSFWLILTGLMYMYYSTVVTSPVLFMRDNVSGSIKKQIENLDGLRKDGLTVVSFDILKYIGVHFYEILLAMSFLAHIWVGLFCYYAWKHNYKFKLFDLFFLRIFPRCYGLLFKLTSLQNNKEQGNDEAVQSKLVVDTNCSEYYNLDIKMIVLLGFVLIPIGIIGTSLFILNKPEGIHAIFDILYAAFVILIANAGWALIPSLLSSRFPIHLRNTGASLAYNGGLVIGFASPFIIMEFYLNLKSEYVIYLAMILGSISIIAGGIRLMRPNKGDDNKTPESDSSIYLAKENNKEQ